MPRVTAICIDSAESKADVAAVRRLLTEYGPSLAVDLEYQGFAEELRSLPGRYAPPRGVLLLARHGRRAVGCVALRPMTAEADCEMKRLYVRASHRGRGLGRRLAQQIITRARELGYRRMLLDSLPSMTPAMQLYRSLGFRDTEPYTASPVPGTVFLELPLSEPAG